MLWGRCAAGEKYHALVEGRPMCGLLQVTEPMPGIDPAWEDRCGNCDEKLRRMGRMKKPKKKASSRADYRPRKKVRGFR